MNRFVTVLLTALSFTSAQVIIVPHGTYTTTPGGTATFTCLSQGNSISSVQWLVNGTELEHLSLPNIVTDFSPIGMGVGTLQIMDIPSSYNRTSFRCTSESLYASPDAVLLLLQGLLSNVRSLNHTVQNSTIFLDWNPPFTLDIVDEPNDIQGYCVGVEIGVIFTVSTQMVLSECTNFNITKFQYPISHLDGCFLYIITVFAVNIVGNGSRSAVYYRGNKAYFENFSVIARRETVTADVLTYSFTMSAPVCTAELTFVDLNTGDRTTLRETDLAISDSNITFSSDQLATNRRFIVIVRATNAAGSATSERAIGTHDITSMSMTPNGRMLTVMYSRLSNTRGALFSFVFITDSGDVDFTRSALLALDRNISSNYPLPFNLYPGRYRVFVYDIEHDGTLSSGVGYPAVKRDLYTTASGVGPPRHETEDCRFAIDVHTIIAQCRDLDVFQVIAQLVTDRDIGKLYINHGMSPVPLTVDTIGEYQVTIIAIRTGEGILGSNVAYSDLVTVSGTSTTTTAAITTITPATAAVTMTTARNDITVPLIIGVIAAVVVVIIVCCTILLICKRDFKCMNFQSSSRSCDLNQTRVTTLGDEDEGTDSQVMDNQEPVAETIFSMEGAVRQRLLTGAAAPTHNSVISGGRAARKDVAADTGRGASSMEEPDDGEKRTPNGHGSAKTMPAARQQNKSIVSVPYSEQAVSTGPYGVQVTAQLPPSGVPGTTSTQKGHEMLHEQGVPFLEAAELPPPTKHVPPSYYLDVPLTDDGAKMNPDNEGSDLATDTCKGESSSEELDENMQLVPNWHVSNATAPNENEQPDESVTPYSEQAASKGPPSGLSSENEQPLQNVQCSTSHGARTTPSMTSQMQQVQLAMLQKFTLGLKDFVLPDIKVRKGAKGYTDRKYAESMSIPTASSLLQNLICQTNNNDTPHVEQETLHASPGDHALFIKVTLDSQLDYEVICYRRTTAIVGRGAYTTVEELVTAKGEKYAGKVLHRESVSAITMEECEKLGKIQHDNIVQFKGVAFVEEHPMLIMEKMDTSLRKISKQLLVPAKCRFLLDVLTALNYLHRTHLTVHGNLTAHNVLINTSTKIAKISDLKGFEFYEPPQIQETLLYMPPELNSGDTLDYSTDIFSFGHLTMCTVNNCFPGDLPSIEPSTNSLVSREFERRKSHIDQLYEKLGARHPVIVAIGQCLSDNAEERPSAEGLMQTMIPFTDRPIPKDSPTRQTSDETLMLAVATSRLHSPQQYSMAYVILATPHLKSSFN